MNRLLHVAKDFALPVDLVTQTIGVLAKRGAGKSYTAAVLAEEMLGASLPVVIADPVGVFWGLRAAANGRDPGLPILIMGGDHGDVPLEVGAGEVVADLVVDERISAVLDLSRLRKGEQARFMETFAERLYQRNRQALHLVLDEADAFAPQRPMPGEQRLLGAIEDLVRRGRARGIGLTLVTQRAAVLNKNVLTQAQVLVALRTIAPQDRDAIDAWVEVHGTKEQRRELMDSLAALPIGAAWWWSPGWPTGEGIFRRVTIRRRRTFDSSATPEVGAAAATPKKLAAVDLEGIRKRMAATVERAQAADPRRLQRRVAELERELARKPIAAPAARVEVEVIKPRQVNRLAAVARILERRVAATEEAARIVRSTWQELDAALKRVRALPGEIHGRAPHALPGAPGLGVPGVGPGPRSQTPAAPAAITKPFLGHSYGSPRGNGRAPADGLTGPERKLLTALAQHGARTTRALALLTGYAASGGAFRNPLSALRAKTYVEGRETVRITDTGVAALGAWDPLPIGQELLRYWLEHLPGPERKLLGAVTEAWPRSIATEALAAATGYEASGGAFRNPLSRLRTLDLVAGRGELRAADELFADTSGAQ